MERLEVNEIMAWLAFAADIAEGWPETNHRGFFGKNCL
jgi:hypothetical protein